MSTACCLSTLTIIVCLWLSITWGAPVDDRPSVTFDANVAIMDPTSDDAAVLSRQRRATLSAAVVRNPCPCDGHSTGECCGANGGTTVAVRLDANARIARLRLGTTRDGLNTNCGKNEAPGLTSTMPSDFAGMNLTDKLKTIYKLMVPHVAYMHAITNDNAAQRETQLQADFNSCTEALQTTLCHLKCLSGISDAELTGTLEATGRIEMAAGSNDTSRGQRDCVVISSTLLLLDQLLSLHLE